MKKEGERLFFLHFFHSSFVSSSSRGKREKTLVSRSPCVACVREWISIISLSQRACFAALQSQRRKKKKRESERETRRSDQRAAIVRRRPRCSSSLSRSPPALHASRARSVFPVGVKHSTSSARPSGEIRKGNRPWARSSPGEKQEQLGGQCAIEFPALFLSSIALPARPSCPSTPSPPARRP